MVKHLEHDYELESAPTGFVPHFWDTMAALGGWKGIALMMVGIIAFYGMVIYFVTTGRNKREAKKKR